MKAISLFGGTGFVGKHLQAELNHDHELHVRDRWMRRPVPGQDSDTIWLISTTHNYNVYDDATLDVKTNLVTLTEALESHKNDGFKGVFNFISSWFVYGEHGTVACTENLPCYPRGFYSITKHCAEQLVESYCTTFGIKYRILRLCNVVGHGDGFSARKNALQYLIDKMKKGEDIEIYGNGRFYRNYMHVIDVCKAIRKVMEKGKVNTIYNIGHPEHRWFIEHVDQAAELLKFQGEIKFGVSKSFHSQVQATSFRMNTDKLYRDTSFYPGYSLNEMIEDLVL